MTLDEALETAAVFAEVHARRDIPVSASADVIVVLASEVQTLRKELSLARDQLAGNAGTIESLRQFFDEHKAEIERLRKEPRP